MKQKGNYYFLVNNDYHIEFIKNFLHNLPNKKILLKAPVLIKNNHNDKYFDRIENYEFKELSSLFFLIFRPFFIFKKIKFISKQIEPNKNDILFLSTDFLLLNHLIVKKFYECKIFLLEDGAATMTYFNMLPNFPGIKIKFKEYILKYVFGFNKTSFRKYDRETVPVLDDDIFKGAIVNLGKNFNRNITVYNIKTYNLFKLKTINDSAIFFNQNLYDFYCSYENYLIFIKNVIDKLSFLCKNLYFKFHPADNAVFKKDIQKYIHSKYSNVEIIVKSTNAEKIIYDIPAKHIITINSSSVLNLVKLGCNPVFLNQIFNKNFPNPTSLAFNQFLDNIECNYPDDLNSLEILSKTYYNSEKNEGLEILKIIND